jgi:hypothetical protein
LAAGSGVGGNLTALRSFFLLQLARLHHKHPVVQAAIVARALDSRAIRVLPRLVYPGLPNKTRSCVETLERVNDTLRKVALEPVSIELNRPSLTFANSTWANECRDLCFVLRSDNRLLQLSERSFSKKGDARDFREAFAAAGVPLPGSLGRLIWQS